jgi:GT2 family glycosyltransferase
MTRRPGRTRSGSCEGLQLNDHGCLLESSASRARERGVDAIEADLRQAAAELQQLRTLYGTRFFRVMKRLHWLFTRAVPTAHPVARLVVWCLVKLWEPLERSGHVALLHRWADRLLFADPPSYWIFTPGARRLLRQSVIRELRERLGTAPSHERDRWFQNYRVDASLLTTLRARRWPSYAPVFSVIVRPRSGPAGWVSDSVASVLGQTYPHWELLYIGRTDVAPELPSSDRVHVIDGPVDLGLKAALDSARGDYVCWLDEGDALEPHALHRFAEAALEHEPDLLYSDEAVTGNDLDDIHALEVRPQFSYDHYLSTAYFQHLTAVRPELLGTTDRPDLASDDDIVLRALERARGVVHVPDILYRHRRSPGQHERASRGRAARVREHLHRVGCEADVVATDHPDCFDVRYKIARRLRIAIIIPTKNRSDLLRRCIESLDETVPHDLASIHVLDHASDDPEARAYLAALAPRHRVTRYEGPFNFSSMMNYAVRRTDGYTHYLFMNNDTEALRPGWLEHMASLGQRADVGIVGAVLLYPDRTVQHAGAMLGMYFSAAHPYQGLRAYGADGRRVGGRDMCLLATRELSAVTAACMLVSAEAFHAVVGFDPELAIGFGDTDFCLRVRARGYKVVLDAQAVLIHHESATRGKTAADPHPADTQLLRARYLQAILAGDPFYSPFISRETPEDLNPYAYCRERVNARFVPVAPPVLPRRGSVVEENNQTARDVLGRDGSDAGDAATIDRVVTWELR